MATDILSTIAKILNQAENATTEEEAALFFERAQSLGTKYSIELATARSHIAKLQDREQPVVETVHIGERGQHNLAVFCELFSGIGRTNDVVFNYAHNSTYVVAFGMPSDIELTRAIYASVVQQMMQMAVEFIREGSYKNETDRRYNKRTGLWYNKPVDARVAKRNFYQAFSRRITQRLSTARRKAREEIIEHDREEHGENNEGQTGTELVLVGKSLEVSDFYKQKSTARGTWKGSQSTYRSAAGSNAGHAAGDRASLTGGRALNGGRKAIG